jgi:hypothetical protein
MLKERNRAFECLSHHIGVIDVTHPSSTYVPDLLECPMPLPIRAKQIERQNEPLLTTLLCCLQILLGYSVLQLQERH